MCKVRSISFANAPAPPDAIAAGDDRGLDAPDRGPGDLEPDATPLGDGHAVRRVRVHVHGIVLQRACGCLGGRRGLRRRGRRHRQQQQGSRQA
jgi:hypothetical protein